MKKTTMWMMALLLCWGCGPGEGLEGLDELAFGRYEYAGFDTTKFKFYRLKDDNTYQEVTPKPSPCAAALRAQGGQVRMM
jgi:hypothetical protein